MAFALADSAKIWYKWVAASFSLRVNRRKSMQLTIKGKNVDITDSLRDYAKKKIEKISRYFDHITSADITFSTERQMHIIEVNINVNGDVIRGKEKTGDMYSSVDQVVDKLDKQVKKLKEKYNKKHKVDSIKTRAVFEEEEEEMDEETEKTDSRILKVKKFSIGKPMTVSEAIKELESLDFDFFAFLNADNSRINVVYTMKGGYGLIDPVVD